VNHSHSRITLGWLVSGESVTSKPPGSPKIVLWYAIVPLAMPFGHAFFLNIYIYINILIILHVMMIYGIYIYFKFLYY
jgi:hypothetical protein